MHVSGLSTYLGHSLASQVKPCAGALSCEPSTVSGHKQGPFPLGVGQNLLQVGEAVGRDGSSRQAWKALVGVTCRMQIATICSDSALGCMLGLHACISTYAAASTCRIA